jgi:Nickel responsive protein SCO4226-like
VQPLARYTIELSRPDGGWTNFQEASTRAKEAAEAMRREGVPVRFLRSIFVPEDDACYVLYEGPSEQSVREAALRAELGVRRVDSALQLDPQPRGGVKGEES